MKELKKTLKAKGLDRYIMLATGEEAIHVEIGVGEDIPDNPEQVYTNYAEFVERLSLGLTLNENAREAFHVIFNLFQYVADILAKECPECKEEGATVH